MTPDLFDPDLPGDHIEGQASDEPGVLTVGRDEDCSACGMHLTHKDGNVCPMCGGLNKAVPHEPRYLQ